MNIKCTNCGADVPIEERTAQVVCPYCDTALFAQLSRGLPHLILSLHVDSENMAPYIQKFLDGLEIRDQVEVLESKVANFPFWRFKTKGKGGSHLVAASSPVAEDLADLVQPGGDARSFPGTVDPGKVVEPEVLIEEAASLAEALDLGLDPDEENAALVHLPLVEVTYSLKGVKYKAFIEGVTGAVYCDEIPESPQREKSMTLGLVALVSFLLFFAQVYRLPSGWLLLSFPITAMLVYFSVLGFLRRLGW